MSQNPQNQNDPRLQDQEQELDRMGFRQDDLPENTYAQEDEVNRQARNDQTPPVDPNPNRSGNMPGNRDEDTKWTPEGEDLPTDPNEPPEAGEFQPDPPNRPGEGEQNPLRMGDGQNPKNPTPQGTPTQNPQ